MDEQSFRKLEAFLQKLPAQFGGIGKGTLDGGGWWVKFSLDIAHQHAWQTVQELGNVLNYLSLNDRLPTCFKPVSPPPYMNGGPEDFLSWVIECEDPGFGPDICANWLTERLPNPVDDLDQWGFEDDDPA